MKYIVFAGIMVLLTACEAFDTQNNDSLEGLIVVPDECRSDGQCNLACEQDADCATDSCEDFASLVDELCDVSDESCYQTIERQNTGGSGAFIQSEGLCAPSTETCVQLIVEMDECQDEQCEEALYNAASPNAQTSYDASREYGERLEEVVSQLPEVLHLVINDEPINKMELANAISEDLFFNHCVCDGPDLVFEETREGTYECFDADLPKRMAVNTITTNFTTTSKGESPLECDGDGFLGLADSNEYYQTVYVNDEKRGFDSNNESCVDVDVCSFGVCWGSANETEVMANDIYELVITEDDVSIDNVEYMDRITILAILHRYALSLIDNGVTGGETLDLIVEATLWHTLWQEQEDALE